MSAAEMRLLRASAWPSGTMQNSRPLASGSKVIIGWSKRELMATASPLPSRM